MLSSEIQVHESESSLYFYCLLQFVLNNILSLKTCYSNLILKQFCILQILLSLFASKTCYSKSCFSKSILKDSSLFAFFNLCHLASLKCTRLYLSLNTVRTDFCDLARVNLQM